MSEFGLRTPKVVTPINSSDFNSRVRRPSYSVLDTRKFDSQFGSVGSGVTIGIRNSIKKLLNSLQHINNK